MKKRSFVFLILLLAVSWFWFANDQVNADTTHDLYRTNCRINRAAEKNVFIDENGDRIYHNVDQKVLWELANDFCVSLDLLVAYNFILVPREPVQYIYIKLPPGPEELGWFPGRSLRRTTNLHTYSDNLFWNPDDPLGPENLAQKQAAHLASNPIQLDPFFLSDKSPDFTWPISLNDGVVSQLYHRNHHGVDIAVPIGTPVDSMANGWIIRIEEDHHIFGKLIVIDHGNDLMGVYGHLAQIGVQEGQFVWKGEQIAHSGNSGRSSAPHLHIEIRDTFRYVDPCTYLMNCPLQAFHGPRPLTPVPTPLVLEQEENEFVAPPQGGASTTTQNQGSPTTFTMPQATPQSTPNTIPPRPARFPATSTPTP